MDATPPANFQVTVKILHKETNQPLPNLMTVLLDLDSFNDPENLPVILKTLPKAAAAAPGSAITKLLSNFSSYNRLFSGITDAEGKTAATVWPRDFNTGKENEQKPDLLLLVLAPEEPGLDLAKRLLYFSTDFRVNAGSSEAYIVRLATVLLVEKQLPVPSPDTNNSVDAKIAAYHTNSAADDQFHSAILEVEQTKTRQRQADFVRSRDGFKKLFTPIPINAVGSNFATFVGENETVGDKVADHFTREAANATTTIQHLVAANKGIEVSFVLNQRDRDTLGFDPSVLAIPTTGPVEADKSFSNIQTDPIFAPVLAKMNAAGADNVILTSNNPILKMVQIKSNDTICATTGLGIDPAPSPVASRTMIAFGDLPAPARAFINGNNGGEAMLVAAIKLTDAATVITYEVRLLADVILHFDSTGVNLDDNGPMKPEDVANYVKKAITNIRALNVSAQTTAGKSSQDGVNDNVGNFSLQKGPAELPSYHDFQVLNIAFGHIWQQLTDDKPAQLAAQAMQQAQSRGFALQGGYANISHLLSDFTLVTNTMTNPPESVLANFDITYEEWNALELLARNKLTECSSAIDYASKGLIYQPASTEIVTLLLQNMTVNRPAGLYSLRSREAETFIQKMKEQGELLIDYIRNGSGKSFHKILTDLDNALKSNFAFTIFGADATAKAVNFGLLNTYRQKWDPVAYQVGNLVKSIPLAPKEERKYSSKTVFTRKRSEKEARRNSTSITQKQNTTSRAEEEIVSKAQSKNTFNLAAEVDYSKWKVTSSLGLEASKESSDNRKDFRESVLQATQEFKQERSVEVDTEQTFSSDYEESGTISNPNDELAVTYLFYELQKRFKVSEQLYRVMPTVLVAQNVPSPAEITEAWVIANDWIINRVILDDSFKPALTYISQKNVGDDFAVRELRKNLRTQRQTVEGLKLELAQLNSEADNRYAVLEDTINKRVRQEQNKEGDSIWDSVGEFFGADTPTPEAAKAREMAARDAQAYAADKAQKMAQNLQREMNTLQSITGDYTKAMQDHLDKLTMVERLLLHIKENILYYMQAIWDLEPMDQRFMRLMNIDVPQYVVTNMNVVINQQAENDIFKLFRADDERLHKAWIDPVIEQQGFLPLVEVADLDKVLGYRGNYMVFPMKQHNGITQIMAMPYVDAAFGAMDPDQLSNVSLEDYSRYVCALQKQMNPEDFNALKVTLKGWLELLLADPLRNGDEIIVPTSSLYIEMLLSATTLLETFKQLHREWDVYKVQAEVQLAALENLRIARRILEDKLEDPKIDKRILVEGGVPTSLDVGGNG